MAKFRVLGQMGDGAPWISGVQEHADVNECICALKSAYREGGQPLDADAFEIVKVVAVLKPRVVLERLDEPAADESLTGAVKAALTRDDAEPRAAVKAPRKLRAVAAPEPAPAADEHAPAQEHELAPSGQDEPGAAEFAALMGAAESLPAGAMAELAEIEAAGSPGLGAAPAAPVPPEPEGEPDERTLKARRSDVKRAVVAFLGQCHGARAKAVDVTANILAMQGFARLPGGHVRDLVQDVIGGDEFAHVDGNVCLQPVCSACGAYAVPGALSSKPGSATLCKPCKDAEPATAAASSPAPRFCPCGVTATIHASKHSPACALRLAYEASVEPVQAAPGVAEDVSAALAELVPAAPEWRVDIAGGAKEIVTVTTGGKSYWQRYAGPRTAAKEAQALTDALEAGGDVSEKLSRYKEGAPA